MFAFLDKDFIRKFSAIAIPVALMGLINFGVKSVDTLMLGLVGEIQLAGAAIANHLSFVFFVVGGAGIGNGCSVLIAQYWGAGDKARVRDIFVFMYRIILAVNIVFAALAFFAPHFVLGIITTDLYIIAEGVIYLRIMSVGYLAWGFTNVSTAALRSMGVVKVPVIMLVISLCISASLNWLLIFGNWGFPEMGIAGAAVATVIARFVELAIILVYILKFEKNLGLRVRHLFAKIKGVGTMFRRYSLPVLINEILWASSFFALNVIIGRIGREFVAANAIASLMFQFSGIIIFGFSAAAAVVVGNTIGAGRYDRARQIANGILVLSLIVGLLCFALIQIVRIPFVNFYELTDVTRIYALQLTNVFSITAVFTSVAIISLMGTLRGGGDSKFVMVADVIFIWLISVPLGALAGLVLNWPVWIVAAILRSEDLFKAIVVLLRVPGGKWLKDITTDSKSAKPGG
ncbi:MAG: MATE family efflux transporter [Spirochaetes bacterium]|nr:MATE family efflux transporter [Spirochaetota bacterium]